MSRGVSVTGSDFSRGVHPLLREKVNTYKLVLLETSSLLYGSLGVNSSDMSQRVRDNLPLLEVLSKCKPQLRKAILEHADHGLIKTLGECSLNIISGNISISKNPKTKLARHKKRLRVLGAKRTSLKHKRVVLQQQGGNILAVLLPPILTALKSIL